MIKAENTGYNRKLIIITGPTGVGKTGLSIKTALALNAEIISADSMQVYKYMDIGTAKINKEEMKGIKHHLIDTISPQEEYNVSRFKEDAQAALKEIYARKKLPIIVGGTGFYIQALLYDIDFTDRAQTSYRKELLDIAKLKGNEFLFDMLRKCDPKACEYLHFNDVARVSRALEFYHETGRKISEHNKEERLKSSQYDHRFFVLNEPREILYDSINKRVDKMLEEGLVEEVIKLKNMGFTKELTAMKGLGYKEILSYLEGEISYDEAVYILKRDTRHFAKRQLTWFKRERDVIWINKEEYDYDEERILKAVLAKL
ncbi:MAG: tRNA (adenosine(37)-N6)-dimethylallyltransferase MiaA [Lachnospiraceae bacterium]|nr:tRNA (adenosine(37)-N6)-dimethylallyltransferase MiaA [Lachnospiraceae bacterium]